MIYEDLQLAKDDLKWLLSGSTIISDSTSVFTSKKVQMTIKNMNSFDINYLQNFYKELFEKFDFESF